MIIRIVESISKFNDKLNKNAMNGRIKRPITGAVMTADTFYKVFSPERIKLIQRIYKNDITSIYQLAESINKPYEVVFRNIKYLEGIGIIKVKNVDRRKVPFLNEKISIELAKT